MSCIEEVDTAGTFSHRQRAGLSPSESTGTGTKIRWHWGFHFATAVIIFDVARVDWLELFNVDNYTFKNNYNK
jgi:hypothetical protein